MAGDEIINSGVSLDTPEPAPEPGINLDTDGAIPPSSPAVAATRGAKAALGLPGLGLLPRDYYQGILDGDEAGLRQKAADYVNQQRELARNQTVSKLMVMKQGPLNDEENSFVEKLLNRTPDQDPNSVFEDSYSSTLLNTLKKAVLTPDSDASNVPPEILDKDINYSTSVESRKQFMNTYLEKAQEAYQNQSTFGAGVDIAKSLVPGYMYLKKMGQGSSYYEGENIEQQFSRFIHMPEDQFKAEFAAKVEPLIKDNPALAAEYIENILGQSQSDRFYNNILPLFDVSLIGGVAAKGAKIVNGVNTARTAIRQLMKSGETERFATQAELDKLVTPRSVNIQDVLQPYGTVKTGPITKSAVFESIGDIKEAGIEQAIMENGKPTQPFNGLPSMFSPVIKAISEDTSTPGNLRQELVNKIIYIQDRLTEIRTNSLNIDRMGSAMQVDKNIRDIEASLKTMFPDVSDNIADIRIRYDDQKNLYYPDFYITNGDKLWTNRATAQKFFTSNKFQDMGSIVEAGAKGAVESKAEQKGVGFYIKVTPSALNETGVVIRDALLHNASTKTPGSWLNAAVGGLVGQFRTPEETLAATNRINRLVATYGPSNFFKLIKENSKDIKSLRSWPGMPGRAKWNEWKQVVQNAEEMEKKGGPSIQTPSQLSSYYQQWLHRTPDAQETRAFFSHVNNRLIRETLDNHTVYSNKARTGAQTHTISIGDPAQQMKGGLGTKSMTFDAFDTKDIPKNAEIVLLGEQIGQERYLKTLGKNMSEQVQNGGAKLLRFTDPNELPLKGILGDQTRPKYVLVRPKGVYKTEDGLEHFGHSLRSQPLSWRQIPPGKYLAEANYDHYITQAIVKDDTKFNAKWYVGDRTLAGFNVRAMARDVTGTLNDVRLLLKDGREAAAADYLRNSKLPFEIGDIKHNFTSGKWDLHEPFQVTPRNNMIINMDEAGLRARHGPTFQDASAEGYGRYFKEGQRDTENIFSLENEGTRQNPSFKEAQRIERIDPIQNMNRALSRVVNNYFLNDYKIYSVEHWIQEAKGLLDVSAESLASNPYTHFYNPKWIKGADTGDMLKLKNNLMTANYQIKQFLGIKSEHETWLHAAQQHLMDSVYGGNKFAAIPLHLLPTIRDPSAVLRSWVFHVAVGFLSPAQLFVQAHNFATIAGIAGFKYAVPGSKAFTLHFITRLNETPEMLARLDKIASTRLLPGTSVWKPGEFLEWREVFKNSGLEHVGGEYGMLDSLLKPDIIRTERGDILNVLSFFFREGERFSRTVAHATAYRELRDLKPTGALTKLDQKNILARADLLNANMSRASNSRMNQGWLSSGTQFLSYQERLTEIFLGKRLTPVEKTRLFATYSAFYGLPGALGLTGLPIGDLIIKHAVESGDVDAKRGDSMAQWVESAVTHGLPATMLALATGNWYNYAERFGVSGFTPLESLWRPDKTVWDIFGGPSESKFAQFLKNNSGMMTAASDAWNGTGEFKLHAQDWLGPLKVINSVSSADKYIAALNYGKWYSSSEEPISDVSASDATLMFLSGLQPEVASDAFRKHQSMQDQDEQKKKAENFFSREMRRMFRAVSDGNPQQANEYYKNAFIYLKAYNYPLDMYGQAMDHAFASVQNLPDRTAWDFYLKHQPQGKEQLYLNTYYKRQGRP